MTERLVRAIHIGKHGALRINLHVIFGALIAVLYLVLFRREDVIKVLLFAVGGVTLSLTFWFGILFGLAFAFPPPPDRLEFPGAGKVVWPLIALLTLATVWLVLWKK
jgi:hypothetical protein